MTVIYEVIMTKRGRIQNGFFKTKKEAQTFYKTWKNLGFEGEIVRMEYNPLDIIGGY
jgi:hypothetical protein